MSEASKPPRAKQGAVAAALAAGGGPIHGWEGIWRGGLDPGELWDAKRPSPVLSAKLASGRIDVKDKVCLVPGCGRGYDVLAFAEAGASLVVGLELSSTTVQRAEEHAASLHLAPWLAERISYQQGDFLERTGIGAAVSEATVDFGFDYTFLCALQPEQQEAWAATWAALVAPGGRLATLVFPIDPSRPPGAGPPFPVTPQLYRDLLEPAGFEQVYIEEVPEELSHPGRGGMEAFGLWRRLPPPTASL